MANNWKNRGLVTLTLAVVLALLVAGCAAPGTTPAEEKVAKIGTASAFTGALASTGTPIISGQIDYVKWLNEHGGIDGVKVDIRWEETGGTVPKEITALRRFKDGGRVGYLSIIASAVEANTPYCQRYEIPCVHAVYRTVRMETGATPWIFNGYSGEDDLAATCVKWVKDNWKESRPPRFGYWLYDHVSGWEGLAGAQYACEKLGVEFVGYEVSGFIPPAIDTTTEWLRLAGKKPDFVYFVMCGATFVVVVKDGFRLEMQKKGIKLIGNPFGLDEVILRTVGDEASEGWLLLDWRPYSMETTDYPGLVAMNEAAKKWRGWEPAPRHYNMGWNMSMILCEGIRLAIEKVGLENLTGRAVRDGLASVDFDTGTAGRATMTNEEPYPWKQWRMYEVRSGKSDTIITDWFGPMVKVPKK